MLNLYSLMFKAYSGATSIYTRLQQICLKTRSISPLRTNIYLTYKCNCNCYMCFFSSIPSIEELTFSDVKNVIEELPRGSIITLTGGEPTMAKDFMEIAGYASKNHKVQIRTNGSNFDKLTIERLVDSGVWALYFSIDAPKDYIHDSIRKSEGVFQKAVSAIKEINNIKRSRRLIKPFIQVNTVILKESISYLPEMVQLCDQLGVDSLSFNSDNRGSGFASYSADQLDRLVENIEKSVELAKKTRIDFHVGPNLRVKDMRKIDMSDFTCYAPWTTLEIFPDGSAGICGVVLGNVKKDRIKDLWNNKAAQDCRSSFLKGAAISQKCLSCCNIVRRA